MKYEHAFKIEGTKGFLTKAYIYYISNQYLIFVEVTEIHHTKPMIIGRYCGIVDMISDHNLEWVCNYGSAYEIKPVMTASDIREWTTD